MLSQKYVSKQLPWTKHMWSLSPSPDFCWTANAGASDYWKCELAALGFHSFSVLSLMQFSRERFNSLSKIGFSEDSKTKALKRSVMLLQFFSLRGWMFVRPSSQKQVFKQVVSNHVPTMRVCWMLPWVKCECCWDVVKLLVEITRQPALASELKAPLKRLKPMHTIYEKSLRPSTQQNIREGLTNALGSSRWLIDFLLGK